ncbi:hypothetical protein VP01_3014g3 [Puccinia sorghi]|uniref:Uncharacterized protein n=1 Tax=Puccinia sorghi TaxID=27349 RepID=A0A0L6V067_9BASI|nr:hypothetical protein VP01_3014g3 [Puccinia sorghi]
MDAGISSTACCSTKPEEPQMLDLCDHLDQICLDIASPFDEHCDKNEDDSNLAQAYRKRHSSFYGGPESCQRTKRITKLYRILFKPNQTQLQAAQNVLMEIDHFDWGLDDLDDLWFGIAVPMKETLRYYQYRAPPGLSAWCYQLMGRPDLAMLTEQANKTVAKDHKERARRPALRSNASFHITTQTPPSLSQLCAAAVLIEDPVILPTELEFHSLEEASSDQSVAGRFSDDMRIIDVAKMLNYTQEEKVQMHESIAEMTRHHQEENISFGGACFWFKTDSNVAASVPMIKLDIKISSPPILIQPDPAKVEKLAWSRFHAGVATGLSLSVEPEEFDSSQISLAHPEEPDNRHAGYLIGLGLNQHLRSINRVQVFRYLETKHEMTSIGVLIGLSSAFVGTADPRGDGAHPLLGLNQPTTTIDFSLTSPAATLALALLYLKTGRSEAAMLCEIPQTPVRLEHIRLDLLMIRALARGLIMWDSIKVDTSWME